MNAVLACIVCARPLDSLLTGGLHAGVAVMAAIAVAVIGGLARGAWRVLRDDAAQERASAVPPGGRT